MARFFGTFRRLYAVIVFTCLLTLCYILIGFFHKCSVPITLEGSMLLCEIPFSSVHTNRLQPAYRSIFNETLRSDNQTRSLQNHSAQITEQNEGDREKEPPKELQKEPLTWLDRTHWESKNDYNFHQYLNTPKNTCSSGGLVVEGFTLLVLVKSAPDNSELRNAIRGTYIQGALKHNVSARVVFLLGYPAHAKTNQMDINEEANINGDIVQEDFQDSYHNLTIKDMMGFKWAMTFCNNSHFVLVTDDDIMIDIFTLVEDLSKAYPKQRFVLGEPTYGAVPFRNPNGVFKKFYTPLSLYPKARYPTYPQGYGYILSIDVVPQIFQASKEVPPLVPWEDVYIGALLEKTQIPIIDKHQWYRQRHPVQNPLLNDYFEIQLSSAQMKTLWTSVEGAFLR